MFSWEAALKSKARRGGSKQAGRGNSVGVFSAMLCLPAAQEGSWEGGHRDKWQQQEPGPREQQRGSAFAPYWQSKNSHRVPLEQCFASLCHRLLASVTQRCFQDHYRASLLQRTAWGLCTSHPVGIPIFLAQRYLPPGASLVPEDACVRALPVGTGAECVVMGTFSCCD